MVDPEPMAFNVGSAAVSGKSTDSAKVIMITKQKEVIDNAALAGTSNQKINERYLAVD